MTKQAIVAIVVGVLILFGAVGAYFYSKSQTAKKAATVAVMHDSPTPANEMQQSITDIFSSGKTSKCTFDTSGTSGNVNGTVYVSGNDARADFEMSTSNNKTTTTHMVRNGDTFYMWGDSLPVGMKMVMNINDFASKIQGAQPSGTPSFDPSKKVDIKCVGWTKDATLLTPPTNIKFTSLQGMVPSGAMMKTTGTPSQAASVTAGATNQCNVCTALTGQAKTACMAQFNCQ
jgi:hypothetical protein